MNGIIQLPMNKATMKKGLDTVRENSWASVAKHGLDRNDQLPLLGVLNIKVTEDEAAKRLICMYAVGASAFGFPAGEAKKWLASEGVFRSLSNLEGQYLDGDQTLVFLAQSEVASAYALAWATNLVPEQRLMTNLPDDFVRIFPDIRKREPSAVFVNRVKFRSIDELVPYLDLAYCLHWALRDAQMRLRKTPKVSQLPLVAAQRKSLEWVMTGGDWDDVLLDT
jgi:hypothetical protein